MACLNRVDSDRRHEERTRLKPWRLILVRGHRQIFERHRGATEAVWILGHTSEVKPRLLDRRATEHMLERRDVRALMPADDPRLVRKWSVERPQPLGLGVEGRLHVLEPQGVVEDVNVVA